jgi:hypothetical protein
MIQRVRFPLMARALLWLVVHLGVLAAAFFLFVSWQLQLGLGSFLSGTAGERLKNVGERLASEPSPGTPSGVAGNCRAPRVGAGAGAGRIVAGRWCAARSAFPAMSHTNSAHRSSKARAPANARARRWRSRSLPGLRCGPRKLLRGRLPPPCATRGGTAGMLARCGSPPGSKGGWSSCGSPTTAPGSTRGPRPAVRALLPSRRGPHPRIGRVGAGPRDRPFRGGVLRRHGARGAGGAAGSRAGVPAARGMTTRSIVASAAEFRREILRDCRLSQSTGYAGALIFSEKSPRKVLTLRPVWVGFSRRTKAAARETRVDRGPKRVRSAF